MRMRVAFAVDQALFMIADVQTFRRVTVIAPATYSMSAACAVARGYRQAIAIAMETRSTSAGCAVATGYRTAIAIATAMCWTPVGYVVDPVWTSTRTDCAMTWTGVRT